MKIQDDIKMYAQILRESDEEKARYIEACNEFERTKNSLDQQDINEALTPDQYISMHKPFKIEPMAVDNNYISRVKKLMDKVRRRNPEVFVDVIDKLMQYQEQNIKLPPPEDFVIPFIPVKDRDSTENYERNAYKDTDNAFGNADAEMNMYDSEQLSEEAIKVDDRYIQDATRELEELKSISQEAYDNAIKYLNYQKGRMLAVDPVTFAKNRISMAKSYASSPVTQDTRSPEEKRWAYLDKFTADKKAREDAEARAKTERPQVSEITITDVKINDIDKKCTITYNIDWTDGRKDTDLESVVDTTDTEFRKAARLMGAKTFATAAVALLQQSFDTSSQRPIKWTYFDKKTGTKVDGSKFFEVEKAKRKKVKQPETFDPAKEYAADLARSYNKAYGRAGLRYTY